MHSVQSLQAEMTALRSAMAREDFDAMPELLAAHDLHLQTFCQTVDLERDRAGLLTLQGMQQDLIQAMRDRQRVLIDMIRAQRTSAAATRAYAGIGRF
ncbi:hypothetical protein [Xanthomonas maliensis]|uniref:hypothetical protein n=1 Tax=Xanthomonas maliensis TaxID=1321368 RepID=UPI0004CF4C84|nr:hypothetical protein [Xanthomonas maliensis]KAB7771869.1 hypothetical protein CKY51_02290 [Xanthomonas maliensis]